MRLLATTLLMTLAWHGAAGASAGQQPAPGSSGSSNATEALEENEILSEDYYDWRVACRVQTADVRQCTAMYQSPQLDGSHAIALELKLWEDGKVSGIAVVPFGLLLEAGLTLQANGGLYSGPLRIRTCVKIGCVAPLPVDYPVLELLRKSSVLSVEAVLADGMERAKTEVSMKGFDEAFSRMQQYMRIE